MTSVKAPLAEFIGTFMLVSSVCGAALFSLPSAGLMTVAFSIGRFEEAQTIPVTIADFSLLLFWL